MWSIVPVPAGSVEKGKGDWGLGGGGGGGGGGCRRGGGRSSNLRESGAAGLVPNTKEGVWVIRCASPIMPLMDMLNYKDKLFDK